MRFPQLDPGRQTRVITDVFGGYDHRPKIPDGAFYDTGNLSARDYPLLATRERRGLVRTITRPGGLLAKDALVTVEDGTLCVNGLPTALTGLSAGEKQLVGMGAYVLVFPDKRYYNSEDPGDFGSMEAELSISGAVRYELCTLDGAVLADPTVSAAAPESPANAALWLEPGEGGGTLYQWSEALGLWSELGALYTRLTLPTQGEVPRLFSRYDGVALAGAAVEGLNGSKILYALGGGEGEADYIVLAGLLQAAFTDENAALTIRRTLPDMDFVCECRNRLWGCKYGLVDGRVVNELYASALGDFKNFRQFLGLSTDSWAASVGSDGPWTGAIGYLGHPSFFKENRIHTVTVSAQGAHRVDETVCRGVQRGSHKSLCVVGESLYYKAPGEVCVWQGGFPQSVGAPLGEERYEDAVGGALDGVYYLSMRSPAGRSLFSFDTRRALWYREDGLDVLAFAAAGEELYALERGTGRLWALRGTLGTPEASLPWMAETGILHYETPDRKYLSRLTLSLALRPGSRVTILLRYDSSGDWEESGSAELAGTGTVTIPIRPRRCDHFQLRLRGEGEARIYALGRVLEVGSDV